ncbi:MAG: hypothetical protein WB699_06695 [Bacteroidota bacterium]
MKPAKRVNLKRVKTIAMAARQSKVSLTQFASPFSAQEDSFRSFIQGLPDVLLARDLKALVGEILAARRGSKPVVFMMGAHVVKVGLSPVVIDLIDRGIITHVAMNSAAAIHDVETAIWGQTSEDVAANLVDGSFGMVRETGEFINGTLKRAYRRRLEQPGYGESLGRRLIKEKAPNLRFSILASCVRNDIPVTVHAAIGTDIVHQQPSMDGAATGELTMRDFRGLAQTCKALVDGGVVMNVGSAVILPEVFLKALTVARNLGAEARGFTTAVFDMFAHYRPMMNVQLRPTQDGGKGYFFIGHHEIMIPLLGAMIVSELAQ